MYGKTPPPEDEEEKDGEKQQVPVEPSGHALTEKRKQQAAGRAAAEKLWKVILTNIQEAQNDRSSGNTKQRPRP